ncbi:MAG TPA: hypothetical protein VN371_04945 [Chlorobaculum sp.]|nr:hypothetical protein [Chlorobaculum sp.]
MEFILEMKPYELLLMGMGVLLFLVSLVLLVVQSTKPGISKGLVAFFIISIIMVGFPAIRSFEISDGKIQMEMKSLKESAARVESGTASPEEVAKFRKSLDTAEKSGNIPDNPALLISIARASYQIGDIRTTKEFTSKALRIDSGFKPALAVQSLTAKHDSLTSALKVGLQSVSRPGASAIDSSSLKMTIEQIGNSKVQLSDPKLLERTADYQNKTGNSGSASTLLERSKTLQMIKLK